MRNLIQGMLVAGMAIFPAPTAQADPPAGQGYALVFEDQFTGAALDTRAWGYNYPWGTTHNGQANMQPSQVTLENGMLTLTAENRRTIWDPWGIWNDQFGYLPFDYTSGTIHTYGKKTWRFGYFEGRFRVPWQQSTWPAFWGLQDGWPPEIDIFEVQGDRRRSHYNYHYTNSGSHESFGGEYWGPDLSAGWHTYAVEWTPAAMTFYVDGQFQRSFTDQAAIAQMKWMYLIIDLQVGGWAPDPVATEYPAQLQCDWVRVLQKPLPAPGVYRLTPKVSPGRALTVKDGQTANGSALENRRAAYGHNQRWKLEAQPDGDWVIRAYPANTAINRVLDVNAWNTADGATVDIWDNDGGRNLRWLIDARDGGWYRITPVIATGKALEASGTSGAEGSRINLWSYWGGANQLWRFDPPDGPIPGDANNDGFVSTADVSVILRAASGVAASSTVTVRGGDVAPKPSADPRGFGDGVLSLADAARLMRHLNGLESQWP